MTCVWRSCQHVKSPLRPSRDLPIIAMYAIQILANLSLQPRHLEPHLLHSSEAALLLHLVARSVLRLALCQYKQTLV